MTGNELDNLSPNELQVTDDQKEPYDKELLKLEYAEANLNIRHYSSLRFSILTVYFAILGGLIALSFGFFENKEIDPTYIKLWGRIGGLIITYLFLVLELNCEQHLTTFGKVAINIEEMLDFKQITEKK